MDFNNSGTTIDDLFESDDEDYTIESENDDIDMILNLIDVLVDGQYIESKRDISLPYMGSSNQRVIDCIKTTGYDNIVLWWNPNNKKENK